ncbi:MAG: 30S ribosomal protein S13 [Nanoarchaeota archaeon]|nr:30S ribosomal protein S13 [Nanoarchaeota archaeon]
MEKAKNTKPEEKIQQRSIVRILSKDIEGEVKLYPGLTQIKGVSWALSNATCSILNIDKNKKIGQLTDEEIKKISEFLKNPKIPEFLLNQRNDFETGKGKHLIGVDLELKTEFDIKRLKKIKSYRGLRHLLGLPSRGQRTKGNFRKNRRKGAGIAKKGAKVEKKPFMKGK